MNAALRGIGGQEAGCRWAERAAGWWGEMCRRVWVLKMRDGVWVWWEGGLRGRELWAWAPCSLMDLAEEEFGTRLIAEKTLLTRCAMKTSQEAMDAPRKFGWSCALYMRTGWPVHWESLCFVAACCESDVDPSECRMARQSVEVLRWSRHGPHRPLADCLRPVSCASRLDFRSHEEGVFSPAFRHQYHSMVTTR